MCVKYLMNKEWNSPKNFIKKIRSRRWGFQILVQLLNILLFCFSFTNLSGICLLGPRALPLALQMGWQPKVGATI